MSIYDHLATIFAWLILFGVFGLTIFGVLISANKRNRKDHE